MKEIFNGIYQLEIPLPRNPLKTLNSYLIKGEKRSLLIDTGFNRTECKEAQLKEVGSLGLDWSDIDFFITHVHGDHSGLVYNLADGNSRVYCSRSDAYFIKATMTAPYWNEIDTLYVKHGYPREDLRSNRDTIQSYFSGSDISFTYVQDGDVIEVGEYKLICIATPGHSPEHMCLYEPQNRCLISGDHILSGITSNITVWSGVEDSLGQYLISLDKVDSMDINLVLPGHRELISDCRGRIAELKSHHENRLKEIRDILKSGTMNAYEVASRMHWDIACDSWAQFPIYQKWFATGESIAHLEYLAKQNQVLKINKGEECFYELAL